MNNNNVNADVKTSQKAVSGDAKVVKNTEGGGAETGEAKNDNVLNANVNVHNDNEGAGGCCSGGGDTDVTIENTGPDSKNIVKVGGGYGYGGSYVQNNNNVNVKNKTKQKAITGDATVKKNTYGGDATTGDAENTNETNVNVDIMNDNSGHSDCGCHGGDTEVTIDNTGPDSKNKVVVGGGYGYGGGTNVKNNNNFNVKNKTKQKAVSGDATVKKNTKGGDATTGDATNSNTTNLNFTANNNN